MIASIFSVERFDGLSSVSQVSKSVAPNGVNPFSVRDTVSFSAEALELARSMGQKQNMAEESAASRSSGENAGSASGTASAAMDAALRKKFHNYLLGYLTSASGWETSGNTLVLPGEDSGANVSDARNSGRTDAGRAIAGDADGEGDGDENGIEAKIKKLTAKMEQIYASDMPDPAKDAAAKVIKRQIDELLAQQGASGGKEQTAGGTSGTSSRARSGKA